MAETGVEEIVIKDDDDKDIVEALISQLTEELDVRGVRKARRQESRVHVQHRCVRSKVNHERRHGPRLIGGLRAFRKERAGGRTRRLTKHELLAELELMSDDIQFLLFEGGPRLASGEELCGCRFPCHPLKVTDDPRVVKPIGAKSLLEDELAALDDEADATDGSGGSSLPVVRTFDEALELFGSDPEVYDERRGFSLTTK